MSKLIRNTYAGWVSSNPILALGDTGFERDTGRSKIGDGVKVWNDLNYFNEVPAGGGGGAAPAKASFFEDFNGDLSAFSGAPGTYTIAASEFHSTGAYSNDKGLWVPGMNVDRFVATVKFRYAGDKKADLYVLARLKDFNHHIMAGYVNNNGVLQTFGRYFRDPVRNFSTFASVTGPALVAGTVYWLRVLVYEAKVQAAIYSVDPDSVPNPQPMSGYVANFAEISNMNYPTLGVGAPGSVGILAQDNSVNKDAGPFVDSLKIQEI
jgi:hypothetical protein